MTMTDSATKQNTARSKTETPSKQRSKQSSKLRSAKQEGFRLHTLEVYNWGTFDQKVWSLHQEGASALLTGDNGSGKSTLVDALLTLLVPNKKRNYNLSSGSERRERSELSYVRGAYGREQNDFNQGQVKYLRDEQQYSVLLATFKESASGRTIALGQLFWIDNKQLNKLYLAAHQALTIEKHFSQFKTIKDLRSRLKKNPAVELFSTFTDYELFFRQAVGLRSSKALDLFNQIVAIKEIGRLNQFVRHHMLDPIDINELLDQLYDNYQNLNLSHQAIVLAKRQLELLTPIAEMAESYLAVNKKLEAIELDQAHLPLYFESKKVQWLETESSLLNQQRMSQQSELEQANERCMALQRHCSELTIALNQDKTGQHLERYDLLIQRQNEKKRERQQRYKTYKQLIKPLGLPVADDVELFSDNLVQLEGHLNAYEEQLSQLRANEFELKKAIDTGASKCEALQTEITSLKGRKNQLPQPYVTFRESLVDYLGVKPQALPFVAELMQVNADYLDWRQGIEHLLKPLALTLLVPAAFESKVKRFLMKQVWPISVAYFVLNETGTPEVELYPMDDAEDDTAAGDVLMVEALAFKPRAKQLTDWVHHYIAYHYPYALIRESKALKHQDHALLPDQVIKHDPIHFEKVSTLSSCPSMENAEVAPLNEMNSSIFGWDNSDRLSTLLKQLHELETEQTQQRAMLKKGEQQVLSIESKRQAAQQLQHMTDFTTIDWQAPAQEIESLNQQRQTLSQKSGRVSQLKKERQKAELELEQRQQQRDHLLAALAVLDNRQSTYQQQLKEAETTIRQMDNGQVSSVEPLLKKLKIHLNKCQSIHQFNQAHAAVAAELSAKLKGMQNRRQGFVNQIIKKMSSFKVQFPEASAKLDASIESLPAFLTLKSTLDQDSLPKHEQRFKKLLNKSVINDMLAFRSTLDMAYEHIEASIAHLNQSLQGIDYTENTFVQLNVTKSRDNEIREFHHMLNNALKVVGASSRASSGKPHQQPAAVDAEESFIRIKKILDRLKNEDRWRKKVTDPRQWADFFVIEHYRESQEQKNFYSDSAGLSGGQKAKLAFTILASAVAYQYGLNRESQQGQRSFRFVVIDEAFSKSDEINARYAMTLFDNLGLQLIVVTPRDKIYVVEPFVSSIFITQINEQSRSHIFNMALQ